MKALTIAFRPAPFTRRVGRALHMIGLMLAGAWPETRMIRPWVPAGAVKAPGR